jgi:hypothetical protein
MSNSHSQTHSTLTEYISRSVFWILTVIFVILLITNRKSYFSIIYEDSLVEWLTFAFLIATGVISFITGLYIKKRFGYIHWFFMLFFVFNILAGLEEISWGQRVFDLKTTGVFAEYSDQNEINFHNTLQGLLMVKTKHIAMYALFIYGVIFPWLIRSGKVNSKWVNDHQLIIPPRFLSIGFFIGSLFMIDIPTGQEEEIGEFFYSICFLLMMLHNLNLSAKTNFFNLSFQEISEKRTPSFNE